EVGSTLASMPELFKQATAWDALTSILNYYSALRASSLPSLSAARPITGPLDFKFGVHHSAHPESLTICFIGRVPIEDAARAEIMGIPLNQEAKDGYDLLIVRGNRESIVEIDNHVLKKVIYVGITIE